MPVSERRVNSLDNFVWKAVVDVPLAANPLKGMCDPEGRSLVHASKGLKGRASGIAGSLNVAKGGETRVSALVLKRGLNAEHRGVRRVLRTLGQ